MPLGNADIDIAPTVDEQRFHAFGPGRLAGAGGVAIGRRLQNVGGFEIVDRQIFRIALEGLKPPRRDESGIAMRSARCSSSYQRLNSLSCEGSISVMNSNSPFAMAVPSVCSLQIGAVIARGNKS
jgi:hypothetical protein